MKKKFDRRLHLCQIVSAHGKEQQQNTTMKKTLLIAAAALAAGIMNSQAQVYSQNIVGYVNTIVHSGFNTINNPLNATNNQLSTILPPVETSQVLIWNGVNGYVSYTYDTGQWVDDSSNPANPAINPGLGFFYFSPASNTVTFAGSVATLVGTSTTNVVLSGFRLLGSKVPYAGAATNAALNLPQQETAQILKWNGVNGYATYTIDTGVWIDDSSNPNVPSINVGEGFFYFSPSASTNWVQSL